MYKRRRNLLQTPKNQLLEIPTDSDNISSIIPELNATPEQASDVLVTPHQALKTQCDKKIKVVSSRQRLPTSALPQTSVSSKHLKNSPIENQSIFSMNTPPPTCTLSFNDLDSPIRPKQSFYGEFEL